MSAQNNGGPAFPHRGLNNDGYTDIVAPGMSVRDWLAGQALPGELATWTESKAGAYADKIADRCYRVADAMLARRAKGGAV